MSIPTRILLRIHRYAGLVAAPLLVFFAVSGVWQTYRWQQSRKDGSYTAPRALEVASDMHKVEDLTPGPPATLFRLVVALVGGLVATSTTLGVVVALRVTRPRWLAVLLLVIGTSLPLLLYLLARPGPGS